MIMMEPERQGAQDFALPFPVEWCLAGIVFFLALGTMTVFGGLMLIFALAPAAVLIFNKSLYDRFKFFIGAGSVGLALLFLILGTFVGEGLRLNILAFILCLLGLLVIAFFSMRDMAGIKFPDEIEKILALFESPMYFFILTIYFSVATVFVRAVVVIPPLEVMGMVLMERQVIVASLGGSDIFLSLVGVVALLVPASVVAFALWRGLHGLLDILYIVLAGSAAFAALYMPLFFWRWVGFPLPMVLLGYVGVALAGIVFLLRFKDMILGLLGR